MSNNFNNFNGIPHRGTTQHGFGELANSLIFPGALPYPQPFPNVWPPTPGWQGAAQENYNMGSSFQGTTMGSNAFFPTQPDFVAFDDGDDFYNNEVPDTPMSEQADDTGTSNGASGHGQPGNNQGTLPKSISSTSVLKPNLTSQNRTLSQPNGATNSTTRIQGASKTDTNDQLAILRAKLMSQRRVGGKTPTPEVVTEQKNSYNDRLPLSSGGLSSIDAKSLSAGASQSDQTQSIPEPSNVALRSGVKSVAKSSTKPTVLSVPNSSLPQQTHTSNDIEALLAEARDTTNMAKSVDRSNGKSEHEDDGAPETVQPNDGTKISSSRIDYKDALAAEQAIPDSSTKVSEASTYSTANALPLAPSISHQRSMRTSNASSESSEQGEIREEPNKPEAVRSQGPPKPVAIEDIQSSQIPAKPTASQKKLPEQAENVPAKQQPGKIDTSLANRRNTGSATNSAKPRSPVSARTPASARLRELRDLPTSATFRDHGNKNTENREQLVENIWNASDRRQDYNRARTKDPQMREPFVRDSRHYDAFRPDYTSRQHVIDENERAAAEYKRTLQHSRPEDRDAVMSDPIAEIPKSTQITALAEETIDYFADVNDWLEMTGYHDTTYRKKAMVRHRKLLALDKERAELEREAQAEREQQSQIIRAQSIKPQDRGEGPPRPMIAPLAFPSFTMPPPPLPAKDAADDVGIQIKDLANREAMASRNRSSNSAENFLESPKSLNVAVKRQHSGDDVESRGGQPINKFPRTNSRDFSSDMKMQEQGAGGSKPSNGSLEGRISVDTGNHRREYQARSRSPEVKQRSLSPPSRRASDHEISMRRQISRGSYGSRNGYSPMRRPAYSRDASPSQTEAGLYDDPYDSNARRYDSFRYNHSENRANIGYDHYGGNARGGSYNQHQSANHRGRGRGRGRGGYSNYRVRAAYDDTASG